MNDFTSTIDELWLKSNVRGYVCPLYQVHSRAFLFPNKELWEMHMEDHTETEMTLFHDIKTEYEELVLILDHAKQIEEKSNKVEETLDRIEQIDKNIDELHDEHSEKTKKDILDYEDYERLAQDEQDER